MIRRWHKYGGSSAAERLDRCFPNATDGSCWSGLKHCVTQYWDHTRCGRNFLIITRGKTACIDDAHYAKYPHFRGASGGWHASEAAVNCQVVNSPCRHTSSRLCPQHFNCHPQRGLPSLTALDAIHSCLPNKRCLLFFWFWERAGMTARLLAHMKKPLMALHTAGVSESIDQTPSGIKLPACPCVSVCVEKHTANNCSSVVTADKISRHWLFFFGLLTLAKRRNLPWYKCVGSLLCSCWIGYEPADGCKQWMTNMTYTTRTELTL